MASQARTIKIPPSLAEAAELRAKALKYPSTNAYFVGLLRYDLFVQGGHEVTLPIAQGRAEERDRIDEELLELTKQGTGIRGSFLHVLLRKINSGLSAQQAGEEIVKFLSEINRPPEE